MARSKKYNKKKKSQKKGSYTFRTIVLIALIIGGIYLLYNRWDGEVPFLDKQEGFEFSDIFSKGKDKKASDQRGKNEASASASKESNNPSEPTNPASEESLAQTTDDQTEYPESESSANGDTNGDGYAEASNGNINESTEAQTPAHKPTTAQDYYQVKMPSDIPSKMLKYTGMTISFNPKLHIPNWVAWELTGEETQGPLKRSNNFMPDPNCPESAQLSDYKNSGYDRGHMCPAADAKWDPQFMQEVFYMTNMCPQDNNLNSGQWNNLEIKCREWAQADSAIIIICGPVLTDKLTKTIGSSKVAVPERFFKVILSPYADPPRAIGFVMPNRSNPGGLQQNSYSIDQVEEITGYDFFSILDDQTENNIESVNEFQKWSKLKKKK